MATTRHLPIWKKAVFGFGVTVVFFLSLEGLLAVVGVRAKIETHDPFVGFASTLPLFVESHDDGVMTTAQNKLAYFNKQSFDRTKSAGSFRIFCLGGSTTYGRPYDDTTSFPGWLRELLPIADPETNWEVINAGGISYASYRVAALMEELASYNPDLFIVYTGHNEFLEDRTYGKIRRVSRTGMNLIATVTQTRTFALLKNAFGSTAPPTNRHELPAEVDAALDHTVGPSSYHRDDEKSEKILNHFEVNLSRISTIAHNCDANVVLVTPAANLKDFSPFKNEYREGVDRERFAERYDVAKNIQDAGDLSQSLEMYQSLEKLDDRFAELHFRKARVLLALDRFAEASTGFQRAVDEDVCPLRAGSEIEKRIRQVTGRLKLPLVDFKSHLRRNCLRNYGHNIPGNEYFLDHVHPNIETNGMIARTIVDRLIEDRIVGASKSLSDLQFETARKQIQSKVDTVDHALALRNLAKVLNWAGKHIEAGPLALKALKTLSDDPEILVLSAAYLTMTGDSTQAIAYYQKAIGIDPNYAEAHQMLGATLVDDGEYEQAIGQFKQVVRLNPEDSHAHLMIGALLAELNRFEEAIDYFRSALELDPESTEIRARLHEAVQGKRSNK